MGGTNVIACKQVVPSTGGLYMTCLEVSSYWAQNSGIPIYPRSIFIENVSRYGILGLGLPSVLACECDVHLPRHMIMVDECLSRAKTWIMHVILFLPHSSQCGDFAVIGQLRRNPPHWLMD